MIDVRDREYISQYGTDLLGLRLHGPEGTLADPDDNLVTLNMFREGEQPVSIFSRAATRVDVGTYETALLSSESAVPGPYTLRWNYRMGGNDQTYETFLQIGESAPAYDALSPGMKALVDSVWIRFADCFDSPGGGPNLQTYFQTHYGRGRMAQLLRIAVGKLNTTAQPHQTYTLDDGQGGGAFPIAQWGSLLESALYVECLKHLRRSYVEQPMFQGSGAVSRLDRRDYMDRWGMILQDEESTLRSQLEIFKISSMMLGAPRVLVSGGVYGRYGPTRVAGSIAARPRYWSRFY